MQKVKRMSATTQASAGLVAYREGSSDSDSDEEYIFPRKRLKADRTVKGRSLSK